ncbi:MAG TPA: hypothetical protein VJP45_03660, partial [Candidatus Limnocylindria bacterium]|nr:hypothetical protein [Candidatus Limnocylindria bacterium]
RGPSRAQDSIVAGAPCQFCLREDVALTREHVFARWLVERLRAWQVTHPSRVTDGAAADARLSRLVTTVCAACNAGWMSGLEVSFRAAVFGRERPERLAAPTRRVLSRWFTKTAMLIADASGQELVPSQRWPDLTTAMPPHIRVGLARIRRPRQPLDLAPVYVAGTRELSGVAVQVDDLAGLVTRGPSVAPATTLWPIRSHVLRWSTLPVVNRLTDLTSG